jgi:hypothetical protein
MHEEIIAQVYGTDLPTWEDEPKHIRSGIRKYRSARRWRVPPEGTDKWNEWFGLNDPEDLPIFPEPTPTPSLPVGFPDDEALLPHIAMYPWHKSKGYKRDDAAQVGAHEYLVRDEHPDLFRLLRQRIVFGGDGYWGQYLGYTNWYVNIDGYKYWATFVTVLNREKLPETEAAQEQEQHAAQLRLGLE